MLPVHATRPLPTRRGSMWLAMKRLTADAHRTAETAVLATNLFDSRAHYAAYLERLLPFYEAIELELVERLDGRRHPELQRLAIQSRRKAPLIAHDLRVLGSTCRGARPTLPRVRTTADALGVVYVLEGKTLGARFLLEEARRRLGISGPDDGGAFLAGYGDSGTTSQRWHTYRASLEAFVAVHGCRSTIVRAARATFEAFIRTATVVAF